MRLGGLAGRLGTGWLARRLTDLPRSSLSREARRAERLAEAASRIAETLGEMKGGAMKLGQMLSLHEGLLPDEITEGLRTLQREAPPIPFEVVREELEVQRPELMAQLEDIEPEAFAAASIGQVHRGLLIDGRVVAIKIQYPEIERIVRADLANLERVMGSIFPLVSDVDLKPLWREVHRHLLEELDYEREAQHLRVFAELHADDPAIRVPEVVDVGTSKSVLTMEYVPGISPEEACSDAYDEGLRGLWGAALVRLGVRGFFEHRLLHADPNLANFAFAEDGGLIVYDLGCVKRVPERFARGYAELLVAMIEGRRDQVPDILSSIGGARLDGSPIPSTLIDPYLDVLEDVLREEPLYRFGDEEDLYERLVAFGIENALEAAEIEFPEDAVFVHRTFGGTVGNLIRLRARAPWRSIVEPPARTALRRIE